MGFLPISGILSLRLWWITAVILFLSSSLLAQNIRLKATLLETDSFSRIPFAIVSLKGKMDATITDESGNFDIMCAKTDTLVISHVTYKKTFIPVRRVWDTANRNIRIIISRKDVDLVQVTISGKRLTKEKKEEYQRHLDRYQPTISSPISAIYEKFSRKGKERSKMDEIYEGLLLRDLLEQRLPPRKLFLITNDRSVTLDDLLILCPVSNYFAGNASDYVFFLHFSKCWEDYKLRYKK